MCLTFFFTCTTLNSTGTSIARLHFVPFINSQLHAAWRRSHNVGTQPRHLFMCSFNPEVIYLSVIQYSLIVVISVFSIQPIFSIAPSVKQYKKSSSVWQRLHCMLPNVGMLTHYTNLRAMIDNWQTSTNQHSHSVKSSHVSIQLRAPVFLSTSKGRGRHVCSIQMLFIRACMAVRCVYYMFQHILSINLKNHSSESACLLL